ncbi:MAG: flagellar basal-body MS-ring/collar protein FliF [Alphaproteobacteria bacterium]
MNGFLPFLRQLGPVRLATMALVGAGLIAFFLFFASRLGAPDLALLYAELPAEDAARITRKLETMNVPYELRGDGTQIYVPQPQALKLRMAMAAEGLPNGGSVGYELFDQASPFGTTSFVQQLNHVRALEGELARTIGALDQVHAARVHLVLPKREAFSRDSQPASASIVLKLGGSGLQQGQVLAIRHLVAAAVPGLDPAHISIVDSHGTLLARGGDNDAVAAGAQNAEEMRRRHEARLSRTVEDLLERTLGVGKVRAEVAADMDFDRVTTKDERWDPDGQVVRSTQSVQESEGSTEQRGENVVSVTTNLPDAQGQQNPAASSSTSRSEETVNFEISKTIRTQIRETGLVRRLSVAVVVDGTTDAQGNWQPRAPEDMKRIEALVKSAVGFDAGRGDTVEVANLEFARAPEEAMQAAEAGLMGFSRAELMRVAEVVVLGVVAVLVILLVVRPLISRAFEFAPAGAAAGVGAIGGTMALPAPAGGGPAALPRPGDGQQAQLAPPRDAAGQVADDSSSLNLLSSRPSELEEMINLTSVDGNVRASSVRRIAEIVEKHPDETLSIMRNWMYQDS